MSRFASEPLNSIAPYVPGEQPQDRQYIKLNTNENPYYTADSAVQAITQDVLRNLKRYSDPDSKPLVQAIARYYGVAPENVLTSNGSDEALAFAFQAFGKNGVCFADVTYGFYQVFARLYGCPVEEIPLKADFTIEPSDYFQKNKTVFIANPNAQTGIALPLAEIEKIVQSNRDNVVVIDQAYVDFYTENAIPLTQKYDNLLVVNTFSKSRSLAGARVGFAVANAELIKDLNKVKYSFHPYNVNSVSMLLATRAIKDEEYFQSSVEKVKKTRRDLTIGLENMGFRVLPSAANFVLVESDRADGAQLYAKLKQKGILVRHFNDERIRNFIRITVGTDEETGALLKAIAEILEEKV